MHRQANALSEARRLQGWRRCPDCGTQLPASIHRHRARRCPGYAPLWAGDVRVKLFAALRSYGDSFNGKGRVRMVTVTAPGVNEGFAWDEDRCRHLGDHRHSGTLGCRVRAAVAARFNDSAPSWWRELHRQARQGAARTVGAAPPLLVRVWEEQRRGLLHLHLVLGYSTPADRLAVDAYVQELNSRAPRHGFGFVDRKLEVKEPTAAAAYLSSYFVAGKRGKLSLRESVQSRSMPRSIIYVAAWLSTRSGITMRSLRLKRYLYACAGSAWLLLHRDSGFRLDDLCRAHRRGITFLQLAIADLAVDP